MTEIHKLNAAVVNLTFYVGMLAESHDSATVPDHFNTVEEWREHLANMAGILFEEVVTAYATVPGWRTPKITWD